MPASPSLYLDWNATSPLHPAVIEAMRAAWEDAWANPASVHGPGRRARAAIDHAREAVAALAGFDARDVVLTSGGTEANNLALHFPFGGAPGALVLSRLEHPSVIRVAEQLEARGVQLAWIAVDGSGRISPEAVEAALDRAAEQAPVRLVTVQAVNHETGVIQPIPEVAAVVHARTLLLHVDAVQAVGKVEPSAWAGADLLSIAAHKIRGPKGIGALCTRPGIKLRPVLAGGAQERGLRPGTQDPAAAAGFAVAAERAREGGPQRQARLGALRDRLESALIQLGAEGGPAPLRNGTGPRVPHVSNLSWLGWRGDELCAALDLEGVAVSSGSACSAGTAEPSPVLRAMLSEARASAAVRVSLGEETHAADVEAVLQRWARVIGRRVGRRQ